jgi:hypothetical protein
MLMDYYKLMLKNRDQVLKFRFELIQILVSMYWLISYEFLFLIDPMTADNIERHLIYVESQSDYRAQCVTNRQPNDPLYEVWGFFEKNFFFNSFVF